MDESINKVSRRTIIKSTAVVGLGVTSGAVANGNENRKNHLTTITNKHHA